MTKTIHICLNCGYATEGTEKEVKKYCQGRSTAEKRKKMRKKMKK